MFAIRFMNEGRVHWVYADNEHTARLTQVALKQAGFEVQLWAGLTRLDSNI